MASFAQLTEGLSGGELEGIINSLISDASIREDGLLTQELIENVVGHALLKHESFTQGFERTALT